MVEPSQNDVDACVQWRGRDPLSALCNKKWETPPTIFTEQYSSACGRNVQKATLFNSFHWSDGDRASLEAKKVRAKLAVSFCVWVDFYNKVCWHSENGKILLFERWLFNNHVLFANTLCFFLRGGHQRGKRGKREKTWETEAMKNVFRWRNHMLMLHFIPETAHPGVPTDSCEG